MPQKPPGFTTERSALARRRGYSPLQKILDNHALIHAAGGALYREVLSEACVALHVPVYEVRARELRERAASALGIAGDQLDEQLAQLGRAAGKPWAKDHKEAALAAIVALAG